MLADKLRDMHFALSVHETEAGSHVLHAEYTRIAFAATRAQQPASAVVILCYVRGGEESQGLLSS